VQVLGLMFAANFFATGHQALLGQSHSLPGAQRGKLIGGNNTYLVHTYHSIIYVHNKSSSGYSASCEQPSRSELCGYRGVYPATWYLGRTGQHKGNAWAQRLQTHSNQNIWIVGAAAPPTLGGRPIRAQYTKRGREWGNKPNAWR
jgi:hypothetical protein